MNSSLRKVSNEQYHIYMYVDIHLLIEYIHIYMYIEKDDTAVLRKIKHNLSHLDTENQMLQRENQGLLEEISLLRQEAV